MKFYIGTSGWMYSWNEEGTLDWYVRHSGLNAIELNMSFYRFPFPSQVKGWSKRNLVWVVKVNKVITHRFKFGEKARESWERFFNLFSPLDPLIHLYLFQAPPNFSWKMYKRIEEFHRFTGLSHRFAFEPRHPSWFQEEAYTWAEECGITWVSVDAPDLPRDVISIKRTVYLRMHGRTAWYAHFYTPEELKEVRDKILSLNPEKVYVFFNNNHAMLSNARYFKELLEGSTP
ncbi:DUF72 domain-containing protein [bacterium]|nr:MAG: DUF72 domain-containing protein [bacterium]